MTLTKKELIQRLLNGEKLYAVNHKFPHYCYYDNSYTIPFRYVDIKSGIHQAMDSTWIETEWDTYEEPDKWWEPKNGEKAYYINLSGHVSTSEIWETVVDKGVVTQGNVFKTKEEAKKEVELRNAKYRVKRRVWELNDGRFLEFEQCKYSWSFDLSLDLSELKAGLWEHKFYPSYQYLKSQDLVEQLIDEMQEDLILIRKE